MNAESPASPDPHSDGSNNRSAKVGLAGFTIGAIAVVGSLFALGGNAGAQESATLVDDATQQNSGEEILDDCFGEIVELPEIDSEELADGEIVQSWEFEISDEEWAELEATCGAELATFDAELDADFAAFDGCLAEQGIDMSESFVEEDFGTVVFIDGGESASMVDLGDGDGSATIVQRGGVVEVDVTGDAEVIDFDTEFEVEIDDEFDAATQACEQHLPEGDWLDWEDGDVVEYEAELID